MSQWIANSTDPDDRSGVARFSCGGLSVDLPLPDSALFHQLCSVILAIETTAKCEAIESLSNNILKAMGHAPLR